MVELFNLSEVRAGLLEQARVFDETQHKIGEIKVHENEIRRVTRNLPQSANAFPSQYSEKVSENGRPMSELTSYRLDQADKRAEAIEARMEGLERKMDGIDSRLRAVETKLGEISGQLTLLVGKIPSWWQPPVSAAGLLALLLAAMSAFKYFKLLS